MRGAGVGGSLECFLFRLEPDPKCFPTVAAPAGADLATVARARSFMVLTARFLGMGSASDGVGFGLMVHSDFATGSSVPSEPYRNTPLHEAESQPEAPEAPEASGSEEEEKGDPSPDRTRRSTASSDFQIADVEVYGLAVPQ